jgi:uncharacterized protein
MAEILWKERVPPASNWSHVLKRGTALRLTDVDGGANVSALFYNFEIPAERYNMPDTLKAQHTAKLTRGHILMSDMGRSLISIVEDTVGWHDPIGGCSSDESNLSKYGEKSYQKFRNEFHRSAQDLFLLDLEKYGIGKRGLVPNVNFFSQVDVDADGKMSFRVASGVAGQQVLLRADMNVLVLLNTCPHPLDPASTFPAKPIELSVETYGVAAADDECRNFRPENQRAMQLSERYFL